MVSPAPAVSSSSSGHRSDSPRAIATAFTIRSIASFFGSPTAEPGWRTTPAAPILSPVRNAWIIESSDLRRISGSLLAALIR